MMRAKNHGKAACQGLSIAFALVLQISCAFKKSKEESISMLWHIILAERGYYGVYTPHNNGEDEGLATFYRHEAYDLQWEDPLYFNDETGRFVSSALVSPKDGSAKVRIFNTHLQWGEKQLAEAALVRSFVSTFIAEPFVLCGDVNCSPEDPAYQLLSQFYPFRYGCYRRCSRDKNSR